MGKKQLMMKQKLLLFSHSNGYIPEPGTLEEAIRLFIALRGEIERWSKTYFLGFKYSSKENTYNTSIRKPTAVMNKQLWAKGEPKQSMFKKCVCNEMGRGAMTCPCNQLKLSIVCVSFLQ